MALLEKNRHALNNPCPYCHAKPGETCKVVLRNVRTSGQTTRNQWGEPTIHRARLQNSTMNKTTKKREIIAEFEKQTSCT